MATSNETDGVTLLLSQHLDIDPQRVIGHQRSPVPGGEFQTVLDRRGANHDS